MNTTKRNTIIVLLVIISLLSFNAIRNYMQNAAINSQNKRAEQQYNLGIEYLSKPDYVHTEEVFKTFKNELSETEKGNDGRILYNYIVAVSYFNQKRYTDIASKSLSNIPEEYKGDFSEEIKELRPKVAKRLEEETNAPKNLAKVKSIIDEMENKIHIGYSESKVIRVFGEPQRKNRTVVGNISHEQWVYNRQYIYL